MSTADVEDLLTERGVIDSRETKRLWLNRFVSHFPACIRRDRPHLKDKWHMDKVVILIIGVKPWLRRALETSGETLVILVQTCRNTKAAKRIPISWNTQFGQPRALITDKLRSYAKPIAQEATDADHRAHKGFKDRNEGDHRPTRLLEKTMGRFKSPSHARRFSAADDQINAIFKLRRYQLTTNSYRHAQADAFSHWVDYAHQITA